MIAISLALLAAPALAVELEGEGLLGGGSLQVTNDFELRYHHFPPELQLPDFQDRLVQDYVEQVNRLNLLIVKDTLSVGAVVDEVALFSNRYILDGELYHSWPLYDDSVLSPFPDAYLTLEKLFLQQRWKHVELTLGDTYASFGRGLALNIVKNTDIDIDTSIRGVKAVVRAGKADLTLVTGLSNRQQVSQDNRNLALDRDIPHMVTGARAELFGIGPLNAGAHGVVYRFGRALDEVGGLTRYEEPLDAAVVGATFDLPGLLGVDWFAEGDLYQYMAEELAEDEDGPLGYALYGSASAYPGRTVLLLELKRTRDTELLNTFTSPDAWEVATAPTLELERVITEDSAAALNSNDLTGARLRADYALVPGSVTPFASAAVFRDCDTAGLHFNRTPETILHPVTGLQVLGAEDNLQLQGGYRVDRRDGPQGGSSPLCGELDPVDGLTEAGESDRLAHLDGDVHLHLWGEEGIEIAFSARRFWWGTNAQQQEDFFETSNSLTWKHGEALAVTVFQDWSDNPLVNSQGNLGEHLYGAVELQWKPTPSTVLRAFYGAYKAGIRCSGGQCRTLPGFEGARVAFTGTL